MVTLVLPGDRLEQSVLPVPANPTKNLRVGPGLRRIPGSSGVQPVAAGPLVTDNKKNAAWIEAPEGRYHPTNSDLVVATVMRSTGDAFLCSLSPHSPPANLPHLAFDGVSKKTRPQFAAGALVYARVSSVSRHLEPELTCLSGAGGGGGAAEGLGELKAGMVFNVSLGFARRLLLSKQREKGGIAVLEELAERIAFEAAVGRNGRVWIHVDDQGLPGSPAAIKATLVVGQALQETDREHLDLSQQRKLVKRLLKTLS